jgi:stearoyl-CoA desaturase (delta-9 desaturase)
MSVQGAVIHWVADHRRHHAFTDEEGDPHSPHTHSGEGLRGVLAGLWHSHIGWLSEDQRSSARRYAPDLRKDRVIRWVDRLFPLRSRPRRVTDCGDTQIDLSCAVVRTLERLGLV